MIFPDEIIENKYLNVNLILHIASNDRINKIKDMKSNKPNIKFHTISDLYFPKSVLIIFLKPNSCKLNNLQGLLHKIPTKRINVKKSRIS